MAAGALAAPAPAQNLNLRSAPRDAIESGTPPFVIFGPESLGMGSPPVDLQPLPDGRLLAVGHHELALGDGVRWEVFRQAENDPQIDTLNVAVAESGQLYAGMAGGFGRIEFGPDARWRFATVAGLPPETGPTTPPMVHMAAAGGEWLWWWGSGAIVSWRPGQTARVVGRANDIERVFLLDGRVHVSDGSTGGLQRMADGVLQLLPRDKSIFVDQTITCLVRFQPGRDLVGTAASGALVSDGTSLQPLTTRGPLAGEHRINDLCAAGAGYFAAAVDNVGIVFFDQTGRTVQVLDRSVDHRLSRVSRLLPAPGGVIWALLNDGIARVRFPSRVSNFEAFVPTGLAYAQPYRHDGRLWLMSDGRAQRGVYDASNRLERFEIDTAPGYLSSMAEVAGSLLACSTQGIFAYQPGGWTRIAAGPVSPYIQAEPVAPDRWLYAAENEVGWLRRSAGTFSVERFPVPGLDHVYGGITDAHGVYWVELGTARLGRIQTTGPQPVVETFGLADGVPDGWVQIFTLDGEIWINVPEQILHFDAASRRFVPDPGLLQRLPGLVGAVGRPTLDARGRLWATSQGRVRIYDRQGAEYRTVAETLPDGLLPLHFTPQDDGVVWMHQRMRLARYDPALPVVAPAPLRALITRIQFPNSNRDLVSIGPALEPIAAEDNAFIVHFLAPNHPLEQPVTFEVKLDGTKGGWVPTGVTGSAAFNHLDQGDYELLVRPRAGDLVGAEAHLLFSILAPWYRTRLAYVTYAVAALGAILLAAWLSTLLERRENSRLERLVVQRTTELHESNQRLASQVGEIQMLSQAIAQSPVSVLITRPDGTIVFANPRACLRTGYEAAELMGENARQLRPADLAPALLAELADTVARGESWHGQLAVRGKDGRVVPVRTTVSPIRAPDGQIRLHLILEEDITEWLENQERQRRLEAQLYQSQKLESIGTLAGGIAHDFNNILTGIFGGIQVAMLEVAPDHPVQEWLQRVQQASQRAKDLVNRILAFSSQQEHRRVPLQLQGVIHEVLGLLRPSLPASIEIVTDIPAATPLVLADSGQLHQVLMNLATNAAHAMGAVGRLGIRVDVAEVDQEAVQQRPQLRPGRFVRLSVSDTGCGMNAATLERIFEPFFTTKKTLGGTGLGLSVVHGIVQQHQGAMVVYSEVGKGSTFMIYLPVCETPPPEAAAREAPATRPGHGEHILLVDDEELVLQVAKSVLQRSGYRLSAYLDPTEALRAFEQNPADFAVVMTDLTMPRMLGTELAARLRAIRPDLPIILCTGFSGALARAEVEGLKLHGPLLKPFTAEALWTAIAEALAPRRPVV